MSSMKRVPCGTVPCGEKCSISALKELIADELVERHSYNEIPPRVEYCLSEKGKTVVPILQSICRWSGAYTKDDQAGLLRQCQKCDFLKN